MKINLKEYKDKLLFIPIGGADQIGLNCYLYGYEGKWIMIDLGLGFADEYYPGIEVLLPDLHFLESIGKDLLGLVLTHAHEDHIGAIVYLANQLKMPLYATEFTQKVVKAKLNEAQGSIKLKINNIKENGNLNIGPFSLEFIGLTHSVPQMQGIVIRTKAGTIFHSGDWKFDHDPVIGNKTDMERLKALGDESVLGLVCDSTNIFSEGRSGSEGDLQKSLENIIKGLKNKLIVVTTFASNIARLYSLMMAAKLAKRKVMLSGTALWRMYRAAIECGYLTDLPTPLNPKQRGACRREELLIIATGCQGERFATISKLARKEHPDLEIVKGDVIIFASKIIPGNESKIFWLFNKFCKLGVEILTEKDHFVHVSGHPCRDELEEMYKLIRPKYALPMHGEPMHINEHCKFVKSKKLSTPIKVENGSIVMISQEEAFIVGKLEVGHLAVDGKFIIPSDSPILNVRRRLAQDGVIIITLMVDKKGALTKAPEVLTPGILDATEDKEYIDAIKAAVKECSSKGSKELEQRIRKVIKNFCKSEIGKEPKIFVQILKV